MPCECTRKSQWTCIIMLRHVPTNAIMLECIESHFISFQFDWRLASHSSPSFHRFFEEHPKNQLHSLGMSWFRPECVITKIRSAVFGISIFNNRLFRRTSKERVRETERWGKRALLPMRTEASRGGKFAEKFRRSAWFCDYLSVEMDSNGIAFVTCHDRWDYGDAIRARNTFRKAKNSLHFFVNLHKSMPE